MGKAILSGQRSADELVKTTHSDGIVRHDER